MTRPIFIVGANRSGTTLLRLILNAHSTIAIPDELVYFRGVRFHHGAMNWKRTPVRGADYAFFVRQFLERNREVIRPLDLETLHAQIVASADGDMRLPYEHVLVEWAREHGKTRWGEKTPGNIFYAREIREFFPDALFINMVRDPRAGVHSMQRASIFSTDTVINALNRDHFVSAGTRTLARHVPESDQTTIRYEDLVANPSEVVEGVCRFVGVPFEPEMLSYYETASSYMRGFASSDINAAANRPVQVGRAEAWRDRMDARDVSIAEYVCRDHMSKYDYEPEGSPLGGADLAMVAVKTAYWKYQMKKHRHIPDFQVMHGFLPRFRRNAQAGQSIGTT